MAVLVLGRQRGAKALAPIGAAGALFAAPTYMFIAAIGLVVIVGLVDSPTHGFHAVAPPPRRATQALGVLLILRAFSSGATAMTGIEVISNSVPVFEPPQAENARRTLTINDRVARSRCSLAWSWSPTWKGLPGHPNRPFPDRPSHRRQRCAVCLRADRHHRDPADRRNSAVKRLPPAFVFHGPRPLRPGRVLAPG